MIQLPDWWCLTFPADATGLDLFSLYPLSNTRRHQFLQGGRTKQTNTWLQTAVRSRWSMRLWRRSEQISVCSLQRNIGITFKTRDFRENCGRLQRAYFIALSSIFWFTVVIYRWGFLNSSWKKIWEKFPFGSFLLRILKPVSRLNGNMTTRAHVGRHAVEGKRIGEPFQTFSAQLRPGNSCRSE